LKRRFREQHPINYSLIAYGEDYEYLPPAGTPTPLVDKLESLGFTLSREVRTHWWTGKPLIKITW
jgi:hypothetical protein